MAQVTFVGAGAGAALNGTGNLNVPYPAGIQANDILVVFSVTRANDQIGGLVQTTGFAMAHAQSLTYSGFTFLELFHCFSKTATGTETGSLSLTYSVDNANKLKFARMYCFRNQRVPNTYQTYFLPLPGQNLQGTTPPPPDPLVDLTTNTTNTVTFGEIWSPQNDALGLCFVNVWDDNPQTAPTGTTGGTWTEATPEFTSTVGTDGSLGLFTVPLSADQLVSGGSFSMGGGAAADPWAARTFILLAQDPGVSFTPIDPMGQRGFFGL